MPSVDHAAELQECMRLEHSSVIMPPANSPASKEVVTAALLVIGGKILSGRTKDQNIGYVAEYLTAVGVDLRNVSAAPLRVTRVRSKGGPISAVESDRRS